MTCLPLFGLYLLLTATAMPLKPAIVRLMEHTAEAHDMLGQPLSHREWPGKPGFSWGEFLGCSDGDFEVAVRKCGRNSSKLARVGIHVTNMSILAPGKKKSKFSTVGSSLGDAELIEPYLEADGRPERFITFVNNLVANGESSFSFF
jgi:hypothetical protein